MAFPIPHRIPPFRWWCQKVLPAVYDDSLSYYELLCKVMAWLNELGESFNDMARALEEVIAYVEELIENGVEEMVQDYIDGLIEDGFFDRYFIPPVVYIDHLGVLPHSFTVPGLAEASFDFSYSDAGMYKNMQGGCMVSQEMALIARVTGQPNDVSTLLQKVNVMTGEVTEYGKWQLGHCNSLTYDKKRNLVWQGGYLTGSDYRNRVTCFNPGIAIGMDNFREYYLPGLEGNGDPQRLQSFVYSNKLDLFFAMTANSVVNPLDLAIGNVFTLTVYEFVDDAFVELTHKEFPFNVGHNTACAFAWHDYFCVVYEQPGTIYVFNQSLELVKTCMIDKHVQGIRMANEIENVMSWDEDNLYVGYLLTGTHVQTYSYVFGGETVQTRAAVDTDIAFGRLLMDGSGFLSSSAGLPSVAFSDYVTLHIDPSNDDYKRDGSAGNPFQSLNELANVMTNERLNSIVATLDGDITEDFKPISIGDAKTYLNGGGHTVTGGLVCLNVDSISVVRTRFTGLQAELSVGECAYDGVTHWYQNATGIICQVPVSQVLDLRATAFSDVVLQYETSKEYLHTLSFSRFLCQNSIVTLPENALTNLLRVVETVNDATIEVNEGVTIANSTLKNYKQQFLNMGYATDSHVTTDGGETTLVKPLRLKVPFMSTFLMQWNMSFGGLTTDGQELLGRTALIDLRTVDWTADEHVIVERMYTYNRHVEDEDDFRWIDVGMSAYDMTSDTHYYNVTVNSIFLETM